MNLQDKNDHFIRTKDSNVLSCTITSVDDNGFAIAEYETFKHARFAVSSIVLYKFEARFYYPVAMEFRLIDNNILYLTEELKINRMVEIFDLLSSSMEKEEHWVNEFRLIVVHVNKEPKYSIKLNNDFDISGVTLIEVNQ